MRAFLALPIPEPALTALIRLQSTIPTGQPVPEDNLHLTIAFLGDAPDAALEVLDDLLSTTRLPAPDITFTGLGTFAEMQQGLVHAGIAATPPLAALQAKALQAARMAGLTLPRRRFRPHVTLTRANRQPSGPARDRLAAALSQPVTLPGFAAQALCLYHSALTPTGARHAVLARYPLG